MSPTISVILPFFNASRFIDEAVASVQAQTYPAAEIIIVNDGSRTEEAASLRKHERACTVLHMPENRGVSMARNTGIAQASGDWIAFLDCDDLWEQNKLEVQVDYLRKHPACRALHTALRAITPDGQEAVAHKTEARAEDFLYNDWSPVLPSTFLVERAAFLSCGLFNPMVRSTEDHECFLRFSRFFPIHCVDVPLVTKRTQADGLSRNVGQWVEGQNRTIRYYRRLYPSTEVYQQRLLEMHASILPQLLYKRQWKEFSRILFQTTARDLPLLTLGPSIVATLVKNRWKRHSNQPKSG